MHRTLKRNLVTTKEASEIFGYNPDYISSLARSHKIVSKREGHSWFVDKASLERYLKAQADLKIEREQAKARARMQEYHANRSPEQAAAEPIKMPGPSVPKPMRSVPPSFNPAVLSVASLVIAVMAIAIQTENVAKLTRVPAQMAAAIAAPTLSAGELVALATYETLNGWFSSASRTLASLFTPSPTVVVVNNAPAATTPKISKADAPVGFPTEASGLSSSNAPKQQTAPAPTVVEKQTINTYPTYVTTLNGVSINDVKSLLATERSTILATVAGMIQPVAAQGVTNMTTIQQVNMIEDLSNLIVRNGDFRGGTFTGGSLSDGIYVGATTGVFGNLTVDSTTLGTLAAGQTTLATTTVMGDLTITGSTQLTSLIAGGLSTLTNGFLSLASSTIASGLFTMSGGASTTNLTASGTGYFGTLGIGTSTLDASLALLQTVNGVPIISAYRMTDAAPSGDFINYKTSGGTTLFRVDNSGNLLAGGIVNSGSQTITSVSTPQFRLQYDPTNELTFSTNSTGTTTIGVNGTAPGLVFTPQSNLVNTFNFTDAASDSVLSIDTVNKRVGIGTTSPFANLAITGAPGQTAPLFAVSSSTSGYATSTAFLIDKNGKVFIGNTFNGGGALNIGGVTGTTWDFTFSTTKANNYLSVDSGLGSAPSFTIGPYNTIGIGRPASIASNGISAILVNTNPNDNDFNTTSALRVGRIGHSGFTYDSLTDFAVGRYESAGTNARTQLDIKLAYGTAVDTTIMSLRANGNVGIGTTSPYAKLSVDGLPDGTDGVVFKSTGRPFVNIAGGTNSYRTLRFSDPGAAYRWDINVLPGNDANASHGLSFASSGGGNTMTITQSGFVGIGAPAPAERLEVAGALKSTSLAGSWAQDAAYLDYYSGAARLTAGASGSGSSNIQFSTYSSGVVLEKMRITAGGNVGVGSTTPWGQLSVNPNGITGPAFVVGSSTATNFIVTNAGNVGIGTNSPGAKLVIDTGSASQFGGIMLLQGGTNGSNLVLSGTPGNYLSGSEQGDFILRSANGKRLLLGTANTVGDSAPTITITASAAGVGTSGNVGIGTTTPAKTLDIYTTVNGGGMIVTGTNDNVYINLKNTGTGGIGWGFNSTSGNSSLGQGKLNLSNTNVSNVITFDSTGNVGVGSTTPWGQLSVNPNGITGPAFVVGSSTATNFIVTNGGNVGIGNSTPAQLLSVGVAGNGVGGNPLAWMSAPGLNGRFSVNGGYISQISAAQTTTDGNVDAVNLIYYKNGGYAGGSQNINFRNYDGGNGNDKGLVAQIKGGQTGDQANNGYGFLAFGTAAAGAITPTERIRIDRSGNVGIGSTTPWGQLSVNPNGITGPAFVVGSSTATNFIVTNGGNVGIGTTSPNNYAGYATLTIDNATNGGVLDLNLNGVRKGELTVTNSLFNIISASDLVFNVGGGEKARIQNGKFGIGTNAPENPLDVFTDTDAYAAAFGDNTGTNSNLRIAGTAGGATGYGLIQMYRGDVAGGNLVLQRDGGNVGVGSTTPWGQLSVNPNGITGPAFVIGSSTATNFIVTNGGNVGIGTTSPVASLGIQGSIGVNTSQLYLAANGRVGIGRIGTTLPNDWLVVGNSTSNISIGNLFNGAYGSIYLNGSTGSDYNLLSGVGDKNFYINRPTGKNISFRENNNASDQVTILSGGNVGVGSTTPWGRLSVTGAGATSATYGLVVADSNNSPKMVVRNDGNVGIGKSDPGALLSLGSTLANTKLALYDATPSDSRMYGLGVQASQFRFHLPISSARFSFLDEAAGNEIVTFLGTGNVGVGSTTPWGQLSVNPNGITGPAFVVGSSTATNFIVTNGGNVGIGVMSPNFLGVAGAVTTLGNSSGGLLEMVYGGTVQGYLRSLNNEFELRGYLQNLYLSTQGAKDIILRPDTTELMRLTSGGNVGVGSTTPWGQLSVNPNGITGPAFVVGSSTATNFIVTNGGNVGIGTNSPTAKLSLGGQMNWVAGLGAITHVLGPTDQALQLAAGVGSGNGNNLVLNAAAGNASGDFNGGAVSIAGGVGTGTGGSGGAITITSGSASNANNINTTTGAVTIASADSIGNLEQAVGTVTIRAGNNVATGGYNNRGGSLVFAAGNSGIVSVDPNNGAPGGAITMTTGTGGQINVAGKIGGTGGAFSLTGGSGGVAPSTGSTGGNGATLTFTSGAGGNATGGSGTRIGGNGGNIAFNLGSAGTGATASGTAGNFLINGGNVGIGTTTPNSLLTIKSASQTVAGGISLIANSTSEQLVKLYETTGRVGVLELQNGSDLIVQLKAYGNSHIAAGNVGNFGVGVAPASAKFEVGNNAAWGARLLQVDSQGNTALPELIVKDFGAATGVIAADDSAVMSLGSYSSTNPVSLITTGNVGVGSTTPWGQLSVNPNGISGPAFVVGSSTATNFIVTNGGNVGIGTTSPAAKLQVNADASGVGAIIRANATTPGNLQEWQNSAGTVLASLNATGSVLTMPGDFAIGSGATTVGGQGTSLAIGLNATAGSGGTEDVAIGRSASATGVQSVAIGLGAGATDHGTAIGSGATASGSYSIALGNNYSSSQAGGVAIGYASRSQAAGIFGINSTSVLSTASTLQIQGLTEALFEGGGSYPTANLGTSWIDSTTATRISRFTLGTYYIGTAQEAFRIDSASDQARTAIGGAVVAGVRNTIYTGVATDKGLAVRGAVSQSANLQEWQNSSGVALSVVDANGNVGIGTTGPDTKLHVFGATAGTVDAPANTQLTIENSGRAQIAFLSPNTTDQVLSFGDPEDSQVGWILYDHTGNYLNFGTNNADRVRIDSSGNVGIGTTGPQSKLDFGASAANQKLVIGTYTNGNFWSGIGMDATTAGVRIAGDTAGPLVDVGYYSADASHTWTSKMYVQGSTGNVGIGTTDPQAKLDVQGNLSVGYNSGATTVNIGRMYAATHQAADVPNTTNVGLWDATGFGGTFAGMAVNGVRDGSFNSYSLAFTTHHGGVSAGTRMTIDKDGNVGIGTTDPGAKLDVKGSGATSATSALNVTNSSGTIGLFVRNDGRVGIGTNNPFATLDVLGTINSNDGTSNGGTFSVGTSANSVLSGNSAGTLLTINAAGYSNVSISSGNVGIGTTLPNEGKLEVKGGTVCVDTDSNGSATSCIANESDQRLKANIQAISASSSLATILALRPVSFDWRASDPEVLSHWPALGRYAASPHSIGLIAQEVQLVLPEAIGTETVGDAEMQYFQLDYTKFIPPLIGAVQALDARFAVPAEMMGASTTTSAVLTADGKGIDLYKLATFATSNVAALAERLDAQETRLTSLEERLAALESGAVSMATSSPLSFASSSEQITSWFASASNGIGDMLAKTFRASEKICVDDQCLTKEDVRALLTMAHSQTASSAQISNDQLSISNQFSSSNDNASTTTSPITITEVSTTTPETMTATSTDTTPTVTEPVPVDATSTPIVITDVSPEPTVPADTVPLAEEVPAETPADSTTGL